MEREKDNKVLYNYMISIHNFSTISKEVLKECLPRIKGITYNKGQKIVSKGSLPHDIYIIFEGEVVKTVNNIIIPVSKYSTH